MRASTPVTVNIARSAAVLVALAAAAPGLGATLLHEYRFSGNGVDAIGGADGVVGANVTFETVGVPFSLDQAAVFGPGQGTDADQIVVPLASVTNFGTGDFSIAFWIRRADSDTGSNDGLFDARGGTGNGWQMTIGSTGGLSSSFKPTVGSTLSLQSAGTITDSAWHHIVLAVDRDQVDGARWYIDGVLDSSSDPTPVSGGNITINQDLRIGTFNNDLFEGAMAQAQLYSGALTQGEVAILARKTIPGVSTLEAGGGLGAGPGATLALSAGATAIVRGDFDAAIDNHARYDMAGALLQMDGGVPQTFETMSLDIGADIAGLDRTIAGHYPLGTVRIGPSATTVTLVDAHDNDGQGQSGCEAVYTSALIIDAGATLNTGGCRIYYETLTNNGTVDIPTNLVLLVPPPTCPGDVNGDGFTNISDFNILAGNFGTAVTPNAGGDLTGDGLVNISDFNILAGDFGCAG